MKKDISETETATTKKAPSSHGQIELTEKDLKKQEELCKKIAGDRLRALRKSKGYTQKELAYLVGVSTVSIQNYEKGVNLPRTGTMIELERILEAPLIPTSDYFDNLPFHKKPSVEDMLKIGIHPDFRDSSMFEKVLSLISHLNDEGQEKVLSYMDDLIRIPDYQAKTSKGE